jgi:hypothetical protein
LAAVCTDDADEFPIRVSREKRIEVASTIDDGARKADHLANARLRWKFWLTGE